MVGWAWMGHLWDAVGRIEWSGAGRSGVGWDGMVLDGMGWDEMGRNGRR